jgi:hypothetical protein
LRNHTWYKSVNSILNRWREKFFVVFNSISQYSGIKNVRSYHAAGMFKIKVALSPAG